MSRPYFFKLVDRKPVPIDHEEWTAQVKATTRKVKGGIKYEVDRVAETYVGKVWVSTVFLGTDHNHAMRGPAVLFETLVFGGVLDGEMERYCTWEEAETGHAEMVKRVQEAEAENEQ